MTDWQPPKTFIKGIPIPEDVRALLKEHDKLDLRVADNLAYWSINGVAAGQPSYPHPAPPHVV